MDSQAFGLKLIAGRNFTADEMRRQGGIHRL